VRHAPLSARTVRHVFFVIQSAATTVGIANGIGGSDHADGRRSRPNERGSYMIRFEPFTPSQFEAYLAQSIEEFAAEHVRGGRWTVDEAVAASRAEHERLLPEGLTTPDNYLYSLVDATSGAAVGLIWYWFDRERKHVFIYDIVIDEPFRRRGYATQTLQLLEAEAAKLGAAEIRLHVFGHNTGARALYERLGFQPTNILMRKQVTGSM
jgi:ribosomal protein S18 acetylase RimI-like enzyme